MRLVVTGGTGNVGTALLQRLRDAPEVTEVRAIAASRAPEPIPPYDVASWSVYDLGAPASRQPLAELLRGATAVVHLAWDILGSGGRPAQRRSNVAATRQLLAATVEAGVPHLVHLSSVAAYAPEPTRQLQVSEDWPCTGVPGSAYSADKVAVEKLLDHAVAAYLGLRVSRLRPPTILQPAAATELTHYLLGRLAPLVRNRWLRPRLVPLPPGLRMQAVHSADVAELLWLVLASGSPGAYNVAAEPVLDAAQVAAILHVLRLPVPSPLLRTALDVTGRLGVHSLDGSWLDLLTRAPLVDTDRARRELGWRPAYRADQTLAAVRDAAIAGAGTGSPRLAPPAATPTTPPPAAATSWKLRLPARF